LNRTMRCSSRGNTKQAGTSMLSPLPINSTMPCNQIDAVPLDATTAHSMAATICQQSITVHVLSAASECSLIHSLCEGPAPAPQWPCQTCHRPCGLSGRPPWTRALAPGQQSQGTYTNMSATIIWASWQASSVTQSLAGFQRLGAD
jgi:hypothetical protein